jgi:hypothetical protein
VLLLVDTRPEDRGGGGDDGRRDRPAWGPFPPLALALSLVVVAATTEGAPALAAALGALASGCWLLDRAVPPSDGLRDHRQ